MPNEQVLSGLVEPQGLGEEPLYHFTRIYLLFAQGLFLQMPEGSFRWCQDETLSEIVITDQVPIPRVVVEQRPAVVTMRGPAQYANLTLDQMRNLNLRTGEKERTDLISCTMTLNCIAKNGVEAQRIGWILMRNLRTHKVMLQKVGGFHRIGHEVTIGPESPPGTLVSGEVDPSWVMVSIYSPFFFQWTERETPTNAMLLQGLEMHMQTALLPQAATSTAGRRIYRASMSPPTIRGRVLETPESGQQRVGNISLTVKT